MTLTEYREQQRHHAAMRRAAHIDSLRRFFLEHGRGPTASECGAGLNPRRVAALPAFSSLQRSFGSFRAALKAAGLTPRHQGQQIRRNTRKKPPADVRPTITDPHWPVILREAKAELERWNAA